MTDNSHHSLSPAINMMAGFLIACIMITAPFLAISRVKSPHGNKQANTKLNAVNIQHTKVQKYLGNTTLS